MTIRALLIANRGEVAIRVARSAAGLGIRTVGVWSDDDRDAAHPRFMDTAHALAATGPAAYLDADALLRVARESGCDAVHPGYGFLAENADFAARCGQAGLVFVGPAPATLRTLGDKVRARSLARELGVPTIAGSRGPVDVGQALAFFDSLPAGAAVMIKAVAGGGGRGMRAVADRAQLAAAFERCRSEARSAFGDGALYVEQRLEGVRHVEVQVIGDGTGDAVHAGERECSIQRRHQKLVEIAPAPRLPADLRERLCDDAVRMARALSYRGLGTFEFLVGTPDGARPHHFIEANPRLQVEHTVTEEVTGLDLVEIQLRIAGGATLESLGLNADTMPRAAGHAIQLRVNLESLDADGTTRPGGGRLSAFDLPGGAGVRVDTCGHAGLAPSIAFDSMIAKLVVRHPSPAFADVVDRAYRALLEFRIEGARSNLDLLRNLLLRADFRDARFDTGYLDRTLAELLVPAVHPLRRPPAEPGIAPAAQADERAAPAGTESVPAPMAGRVVTVDVRDGDAIAAGARIAILESMKMEHVVAAPLSGIVRACAVAPNDFVEEGRPLLFVEPRAVCATDAGAATATDPTTVRPDLAEAIARHAHGLDENRPQAVASRHRAGKRTARENVEDLVDPGTFIEYGPLAVAGQRGRRPIEELRRISPADGLVAGTAGINGDRFGDERSRCMVLAYDYTVLAGTQGFYAHRKKHRLLELAERTRLPIVLFAEGGGGRPGDTDNIAGANPSNPSFWRFARLSGLVPLVGIVAGNCFAGNAVLLGACDVIIATRDASIGMGGPVMIECGGLGRVRADEVGPVSFQAPNGVVDVVVDDEAHAVRVARQYLAYFQGPIADWQCADQAALRAAVPENRLRGYDVRPVIETLADTGSVLEIRRDFGRGIVTAFARIEGRPIGIVANNPQHLAGAIDADDADKAARFMQLCDAFDIPMLALVDTPGFMVGPAAERRALVRHTARMFVTCASLTVPFFVVVLRKGYGLGAMAIGGGAFQGSSIFAVSWPTGEFGAMGLEGAVQLAYRNELAAIADPQAREARYQQLVAQLYEHGKAVNIAPFNAFDDVIDPADTRRWLSRGLRCAPPPLPRSGKKRPLVEPW